jgi:hypothetical protein
MSAPEVDARIQALEARVTRLAEFNQILLDHILGIQNFSTAFQGPTAQQQVALWLINLSDAASAKYRHSPRF